MSTVFYLLIGAVIGIVLMIIISVIAISGKMSDEEYRREVEEYENSVDGSEGLNRDDE